jgi:hypothetical protein
MTTARRSGHRSAPREFVMMPAIHLAHTHAFVSAFWSWERAQRALEDVFNSSSSIQQSSSQSVFVYAQRRSRLAQRSSRRRAWEAPR